MGKYFSLTKFFSMFLIICIYFSLVGYDYTDDLTNQINNYLQSDNSYVLSVKNGYPTSYPDTTYGDAFEYFFSYNTWTYFESTKGQDIVEFTGNCYYAETEVKALIQFTVYDDTFEATYLAFNQVPQTTIMLYSLLDKVFTSYLSSSEYNNSIASTYQDQNTASSTNNNYTTSSYDYYLVPTSNEEYLSKDYFEYFTNDELRLARNEILARHGRIFNSSDLQTYFEDQAWYTPSYDPDTFDSNMEKILNDYEKANIETIKEIEAERK